MKTNEKILLDFLQEEAKNGNPIEMSSYQIAKKIKFKKTKIVRVVKKQVPFPPTGVAVNNNLNELEKMGLIKRDNSCKTMPKILVK